MSLRIALLVLKQHQEWRLGANIDQLNPKVITEAIEVILKHHEKKQAKFNTL